MLTVAVLAFTVTVLAFTVSATAAAARFATVLTARAVMAGVRLVSASFAAPTARDEGERCESSDDCGELRDRSVRRHLGAAIYHRGAERPVRGLIGHTSAKLRARTRVSLDEVLLMRLAVLVVGVASMTLVETAHAQWRARVVARAPSATVWTAGPVQAHLGDAVEIAVALVDRSGRVLSEVTPLRLSRGAARPPDGPLPVRASVAWERVESRMEHADRPPPNRDNPSFSNNVLFGPRHGAWIGYDHLEYIARAALPWPGAEAHGDRGLVVRAAHPSRRELDRNRGAGSLWLAATVTLPDGARLRSADATAVDRFGLSRDVMRVSFRQGDDFLGWLSTYFNVPNVFGSNGPTDGNHQTERYTGADCADVLIGAMRASGRRDLQYVSVASIGRYSRATTPALVMRDDGRPHVPRSGEERVVRWGTDVLPGDLLAIDYLDAGAMLPRAWDHIGALVEDRGPSGVPDGVLGREDVLRHITRWGLEDRALGEELPIGIRVWRWREGRFSPRRAARVMAEPTAR